jgi:hypothetical protein
MKIMTEKTNNTTEASNLVLAQTVIGNAYSICGKKIASVPVELMELDHSYQRVLGKTTKKLMEEWDNNKCNFLIVSFRDNKFYVIDGQHRYSVAKAKGILVLPCVIFTDLTQGDEALMFAQQQDNVNKLTPYDTFKANVACGNLSNHEVFVDAQIKRICDKHNIEIKKFGNGSKGKTLRCLSRARKIVGSTSYDGVACFEWIIDLLNLTNWADVSNTYIREIVLMLKDFWVDNRGNEELEKKLIKVINSTTPTLMINKAKHDYPNYGIEPAMGLCLRDLIQK